MKQDQAVPPTLDEHGHERHPAWGLIGANRVGSSPPGAVLFDSDIRHQNYVVLRISAAQRKRDLYRDWIGTTRVPFIEVAMSEAQWASFVSSMNVGDGVPCTVLEREGVPGPGMPYEPRLRESMHEVEGAAAASAESVRAAFAAYKASKTAGNLRSLEAAIENVPANLRFAAESLSGHAENVVQRTRADIEAMVVAKAQQLGLEPGELGLIPELTAGPEPEARDPRRGPRYQLTYGSGAHSQKRYVLLDRDRGGTLVYSDDSKSSVIAQAQLFNGFEPADGSEQTYGRQLAERGWR